ncbi:MAG: hypothetical protein HQ483_01805 [Rhodospirillales bacterium]|nr:hypothetical protein [Rhodospirillales bacterium]
MSEQKSMRDNPQAVASYLITQHGSRKAALDAAVAGTMEAQTKGDLYALSIWRDVKRILRQMGETEEAGE